MRFFRKSKDISNKKYNRANRLYNNIFKINIKRITEKKIIDAILKDYLNSIKKLSNALIR